MASVEQWTFLIAVTGFALAWGAYLAAFVWRTNSPAKIGALLTVAGFVSLSASIIRRWVLAGHPPVFGTFENTLAAAWFLILFALFFGRGERWRALTGLITIPAAVAVLAFGLQFSRQKFPLTISERSLWIDLHAVFAWLSYTSYTFAVALAIFALFKKRNRSGRLGALLPGTGILDDYMLKFVVYGFITQVITLTTGSYYEFLVFGRWWRWDPVESISLSSWFLFALTIHLKRSFSWETEKLAWLIIIATVGLYAAYWLMVYFPPGASFHVFDIGERLHIL